MTISLKPINLYQEFEPYDVDVDNRPLLDIQDNILEIASLLETSGFYAEIAADPSTAPAGGFSTFTCACVYSNSLLVPIDISKSILELDYTRYPIVLILGYNADTQAYKCLSFSSNITISNKFAAFVNDSQGRLLRVGPGGVLVDQLYYDLSYAAYGYQALYVGKIMGPNSIVFGGNQVNILGNNYYLGKNRDDSTSGLVTVQRNASLSNVVFKSVSVNDIGSTYPYAEFINTQSGSYTSSISVPVYFSASDLAFNQATGTFLAPVLENNLNEVHFSTPGISAFSGAAQTYLTAGINIRSLLEFSASNLLHAASYSNSMFELGQAISTKLVFLDRPKMSSADPDIPIGIIMNANAPDTGSTSVGVGNAILSSSNLPSNLIPSTDSTGITISDYYGVSGGYIGGIQDYYNSTTSTRMLASVEAANQAAANAGAGFTTNGINDYNNSFTLLVSSQSSGIAPSHIALTANGYINLSSGMGILTNTIIPTLDAEVTSKAYVDYKINIVAKADTQKVPLTGTTNPDPTTGESTTTPVTGSISFNVAANSLSRTEVLNFTSLESADIVSSQPINLLATSGSITDFQILRAGQTPYTSTPNITPGDNEVVTKGFLSAYVPVTGGTGAIITTTGADGVHSILPQTITSQLKLLDGNDAGGAGPNLILERTDVLVTIPPTDPIPFLGFKRESGLISATLGLDTSDNLLISSNTYQVLLAREPESDDLPNSVITKGYVDSAVSSSLGYISGDKHTLVGSPILTGIDTYGYSVLGDIVTFWAQTNIISFPDAGNFRDGGDAWNPEFDVALPTDLFHSIFTVQALLNNLDETANNYDDDTWIQIIGFSSNNTSKIRLKYQNSTSRVAQAGYSTLLLVMGKFKSMPA